MAEKKAEGFLDKAVGRAKQAVADLTGDRKLHKEGSEDENRGQSKQELEEAQEKVERKSREVANRS